MVAQRTPSFFYPSLIPLLAPTPPSSVLVLRAFRGFGPCALQLAMHEGRGEDWGIGLSEACA
eukprot:scaffold92265_cov32-Tisochrysis_lutea.AAC.1